MEAARLACRCDAQIDPVARRLRAADELRHANYVCELAKRELPPPEPAPYRLAGDRECANAIDGAEVTLLRGPVPPGAPAVRCPGPCGPCRSPPPPQCLEIARDTACKVSHDGILDPCAHRARILMAVSRTTTDRPADDAPAEQPQTTEQNKSPTKPPQSNSPFPPCCGTLLSTTSTALEPSPTQESPTTSTAGKKSIFNSCGSNEGLTSRIMKALGGGGTTNAKSSDSAQSCTKKSCGVDCQTKSGEARFAGDNSWCGSVVAAPAPPRCREPTDVERLTRRCRCPPFCGARATPPTTTRAIPPAARHLHSSAASGAGAPDMAAVVQLARADAARLQTVLQERAGFKEASRGRSVTLEECQPCVPPPGPPSEGSLELPVPCGANVVRLSITVGAQCPSPPADPKSSECGRPPHPKGAAKGASACTTSSLPSPANSKSGATGCGSLLKTLQKKFTRCNAERTNDGDGKCPKKKCGSPCKSPCAPKPLVCPPKREPACEPLPKQEIIKKSNDSSCVALCKAQSSIKKSDNSADCKKSSTSKQPVCCAPVLNLLFANV